MKRWINTEVISKWNKKTQRYETFSSDGYWYDGDIILAQSCNPDTEVELWGECYDIESTTSLNLPFQGLEGPIPSEIGNLTYLTSLNLSVNQLTELPPEIGNLTNLIGLYLNNNRLTSMPESICELNIDWNIAFAFTISNNQLCPPYPDCISEEDLGYQDTSECEEIIYDCAGVPNGDAVEDECGICGGDGSDDLGCGCFEAGPSGCDNTCGSTLENDDCGVCGGENSGGECVTMSVDIIDGINWISINVVPSNGDMSLNSILSSLSPEAGDFIKSQDASAEYYDGGGWYGSIEYVDPTKLYQLTISNPGTLEITGYPVDITTPIDLITGWNWIGYLPQYDMNINDALSSIVSNDGDFIKSQGASAEYYGGGGWYGSLDTMTPGGGYMIKMSAPSVLIYSDISDYTGGGIFDYPAIYIKPGDQNVGEPNYISYYLTESFDIDDIMSVSVFYENPDAVENCSSCCGQFIGNSESYLNCIDGIRDVFGNGTVIVRNTYTDFENINTGYVEMIDGDWDTTFFSELSPSFGYIIMDNPNPVWLKFFNVT